MIQQLHTLQNVHYDTRNDHLSPEIITVVLTIFPMLRSSSL